MLLCEPLTKEKWIISLKSCKFIRNSLSTTLSTVPKVEGRTSNVFYLDNVPIQGALCMKQ